MQVHCKQCSSGIPAENLNLDRMLAKCTECNAVFHFEDQIENQAPTERPEVAMPQGFKLDNRSGGLTISKRWFSALFFFLAFFCLFWDGFMVFWFSIAFFEGNWMMAAFGTMHAAVGIGLTYYTIAGFFNKTIISVTGRNLSIRHRPFPFPGKQLNPNNIEQLYCKEVQRRRRSSSGGSRTYYTYELRALTTDGKHHRLLKGLSEVEQALYLEQEIERYLSIQDKPVQIRGEVDR